MQRGTAGGTHTLWCSATIISTTGSAISLDEKRSSATNTAFIEEWSPASDGFITLCFKAFLPHASFTHTAERFSHRFSTIQKHRGCTLVIFLWSPSSSFPFLWTTSLTQHPASWPRWKAEMLFYCQPLLSTSSSLASPLRYGRARILGEPLARRGQASTLQLPHPSGKPLGSGMGRRLQHRRGPRLSSPYPRPVGFHPSPRSATAEPFHPLRRGIYLSTTTMGLSLPVTTISPFQIIRADETIMPKFSTW